MNTTSNDKFNQMAQETASTAFMTKSSQKK